MYGKEVVIIGGNELAIGIAVRLAFVNHIMIINDESITDTLAQLAENDIPIGFGRYHLISEKVDLRALLHYTPDIVINMLYIDDNRQYDAFITRFLFLPEKIMNAFRNLPIPIVHILPPCQTAVVKRKIEELPFGVQCQPLSLQLNGDFCLNTTIEEILACIDTLINQRGLSPELLTPIPA